MLYSFFSILFLFSFLLYVDRRRWGVGCSPGAAVDECRSGWQAMVHLVRGPIGGTGNGRRSRSPPGLTIQLVAARTTHHRPEHLGSSASRRRVTYSLVLLLRNAQYSLRQHAETGQARTARPRGLAALHSKVSADSYCIILELYTPPPPLAREAERLSEGSAIRMLICPRPLPSASFISSFLSILFFPLCLHWPPSHSFPPI